MTGKEQLTSWFQDHINELSRFLYKLSGSQNIAEEIIQETFLRAFLKFHLFDPDRGTLKNWLFRIAINLFRDLQREKERELAAHQAFSLQFEFQTSLSNSEEPKSNRIDKALDMLPQRFKELILLSLSSSIAEIAEILSIPEGTVKSRLFYARKELRRILEINTKEENHE